MKNRLLGTTAIVMLLSVADGALAADDDPIPAEKGFELDVSGSVQSAFSLRSTDECDTGGANGFSGTAILAAAGTGTGNINGVNAAGTATAIVATAVVGGVIAATTGVVTNAASRHRAACTSDVNALAGLGTADTDGQFGHDDQSAHVFWDAEIVISAEQTLANGLTIKAQIELEGQTTSDRIDEHWLSFKGGRFGEFKIGADDNALYSKGLGDFEWAVFAQTDGPDAQVLNETNTRTGININPSGDANKLIYYTPRFSGIQLGVSYAPDFSPRGGSQQSDNNNHVLDSDATYIHEWSLVANYRRKFDGHEFQLTGGHVTAEAESRIDSFAECQALASTSTATRAFSALTGDFRCGDMDLWHVSAEHRTESYRIGGWFTDLNTSLGRRETTWSLAGVLFDGDWEYGLGYGRYEDAHTLGGFTDARDQWVFGIGRKLFSGLEVGAFFYHANEDAAYRRALGLGAVTGFTGGLAVGADL